MWSLLRPTFGRPSSLRTREGGSRTEGGREGGKTEGREEGRRKVEEGEGREEGGRREGVGVTV